MRIVGVQASRTVGLCRGFFIGQMNVETFRIALAGEQQVVVSVRVRMDVELLGVRSGLDERAVDMFFGMQMLSSLLIALARTVANLR